MNEITEPGNEETIREARFVGNMVNVLIKRHRRKMQSVTPAADHKDVIMNSSNDVLAKAAAAVSHTEAAVEQAIAQHNTAVESFENRFGEQVDELIKKAIMVREKNIARACEEFDFHVRSAIGLVELVGGAEAFEVLEECRNIIHEL